MSQLVSLGVGVGVGVGQRVMTKRGLPTPNPAHTVVSASGHGKLVWEACSDPVYHLPGGQE